MKASEYTIAIALVCLLAAAGKSASAMPLQAGPVPPRADRGGPVSSETTTDREAHSAIRATIPESVGEPMQGVAPVTDDVFGDLSWWGLSERARRAAADPTGDIFLDLVRDGFVPRSAPPQPAFGQEQARATAGRSAAAAARRRARELAAEDQVTLRDLVRTLINRPEELGLGTRGRPRTSVVAPPQRDRGSILNTLLSVAVDREMVEAISKVVRPSINYDGVVALNIFGLRDVAVMLSPGFGRIGFLDVESGRSLSFGFSVPAEAAAAGAGKAGAGAAQVAGTGENSLPQVMAAIREFISDYILNGFSLFALAILFLFWFTLRLARRET